MIGMATKHLRLRKCPDGYYRCGWVDDDGLRHQRSFGRNRNRALDRFGDFHQEWKSDPVVRNPCGGGPLTIRRAWARFKAHADAYYCRADGTPTGEAENLYYAMEPVLDLFGDTLGSKFGPKSLKRVRERMVADDLCMNVINARVRRIRRVWKWLVGEELIPASVWHGLQSVGALTEGRTEARSTTPVGPVPDAYVWKVVECVTPTIAAMISVQYYSGMRPAEVCSMRPIEIDTDGAIWVYRPLHHKGRHRRRPRLILLGPEAQRALQSFLDRPVDAYVFDPREAQRQRFDARPSHRHQAVEEPASERRVGERYTANAYGTCIRRVCERAGIPHWSPNQLRHNAATRARKTFGLDAAQVMLGHSRADVTQLYAELDMQKAMTVAARIG